MANKNIQMRGKTGTTWDNLFPITYLQNVKDSSGKTLIQYLADKVNNGEFNSLKDLVRFNPVGADALETKSSIYVPNDDNIFGRKVSGEHTNIASVQQNDIMQFGDLKTDVMWFMAKNYFSFRSTGNPTYQQLDANGNNVGSGRTIMHQGNSTFHFIGFAVGSQVLTKSVYNDLRIIANVNGVFPQGAYNTSLNEYTIPRAGAYMFQVSAKATSQLQGVGSNNAGSIRVSLVVNGDRKDIDDMQYNGVPNKTPFLTTSFMYRLSAGDKVSIQLNPFNEDITIGAGSKFNIYNLGDTIQA